MRRPASPATGAEGKTFFDKEIRLTSPSNQPSPKTVEKKCSHGPWTWASSAHRCTRASTRADGPAGGLDAPRWEEGGRKIPLSARVHRWKGRAGVHGEKARGIWKGAARIEMPHAGISEWSPCSWQITGPSFCRSTVSMMKYERVAFDGQPRCSPTPSPCPRLPSVAPRRWE